MASRLLTDLDPKLQPICQEFIDQCSAEGINIVITCTYRSNAEQDADYAQGRTTPGNVITNAKAGASAHNCTNCQDLPSSRGFDFAIKNSDGSINWTTSSIPWQRAIHIGVALGLISLERQGDYAHLELANWKS